MNKLSGLCHGVLAPPSYPNSPLVGSDGSIFEAISSQKVNKTCQNGQFCMANFGVSRLNMHSKVDFGAFDD